MALAAKQNEKAQYVHDQGDLKCNWQSIKAAVAFRINGLSIEIYGEFPSTLSIL
jgi:hypothetical protein